MVADAKTADSGSAPRSFREKHRTSTKEEVLSQAREFAEDWYLTLRRKPGRGELLNEQSFKDAAEVFQRE